VLVRGAERPLHVASADRHDVDSRLEAEGRQLSAVDRLAAETGALREREADEQVLDDALIATQLARHATAEQRDVSAPLGLVHYFRLDRRVAEGARRRERSETADDAARGDRHVAHAKVGTIARLAVRGAELQLVDLRRDLRQRLDEAIARRVLRVRVELVPVAVVAPAVGARADAQGELFVEADELFVEILRLVASVADALRRREVGGTGLVRDDARRQQAARADVVVVRPLRLVRAAERRLQRVEEAPARRERPHLVDTLVDEAAVGRVLLRRAEETVVTLELEEVRRVLVALELEPVDTTDIGELDLVFHRGHERVAEADVPRLSPGVLVVLDRMYDVEWIRRGRAAAVHPHVDQPAGDRIDLLDVVDRGRVAEGVVRADAGVVVVADAVLDEVVRDIESRTDRPLVAHRLVEIQTARCATRARVLLDAVILAIVQRRVIARGVDATRRRDDRLERGSRVVVEVTLPIVPWASRRAVGLGDRVGVGRRTEIGLDGRIIREVARTQQPDRLLGGETLRDVVPVLSRPSSLRRDHDDAVR